MHKTSHFVPEYNIANNITRRVVVVVQMYSIQLADICTTLSFLDLKFQVKPNQLVQLANRVQVIEKELTFHLVHISIIESAWRKIKLAQ